MGKILLAQQSDANAALIARTANAHEANPQLKVSAAQLLDDLRLCRKRGWAESMGSVKHGSSVIAVSLPGLPNQPALALGLGGPLSKIDAQREVIIQRLKEVRGSLDIQVDSLAAEGANSPASPPDES